MGRLSRFSYRDIRKRFRKLGFVYDRGAKGSHEIWWNLTTRTRTTIPNHAGDLPEGTPRAILKQAAVDPDDFLKT